MVQDGGSTILAIWGRRGWGMMPAFDVSMLICCRRFFKCYELIKLFDQKSESPRCRSRITVRLANSASLLMFSKLSSSISLLLRVAGAFLCGKIRLEAEVDVNWRRREEVGRANPGFFSVFFRTFSYRLQVIEDFMLCFK
jgi:hypothetical protein